MGYTHGMRWTDELIREKVLEAKDALGLDRMPSRKECSDYFHDEALTNAVARRMGWYQLARDLCLEIKESDTYFGKQQEAIAAEILTAKGYSVRKMSQNFPYDLLVNDCIKVDVKASHLYRGPNGNFYSFNLEKQYATCDIYLLFALRDDDTLENAFVVPSKFVIAQNQISIGEKKSRFHRFIDMFDYLDAAAEFWDGVF